VGKVLKLEAKRRAAAAPCRRLQARPRRAPTDSPLTPELKGFIDRVVVPILVKETLEGSAATAGKNDLAKKDSDAAHSDGHTAAPELRTVRP
jgi:hypothetical protein